MNNNKIRNIVQISESISTGSRIPFVSLTALCDDGSVWRLIGDNWKPLPNIPQYEVEPEEQTDVDIESEQEYPEGDIEPEVIDEDEF